MKIFIGTADTAAVLSQIEIGLKKNGHEVTSLVTHHSHKFYNADYTYVYDPIGRLFPSYKIKSSFLKKIHHRLSVFFTRLKLNRNFTRIVDEHDVFIFIWKSLKKDYADYKTIQKKGKKIITIFLGSDVRHIPAYEKEFGLDFSAIDIGQSQDHLHEKLLFLRTAELYSNLVYSVPDQSSLAIRPYDHIFLPFNCDQIKCHIPNNNILKILHAPSSKSLKGTNVIEQTIDRLILEGYPIEYKRLHNMKNDEVLKHLQEADILVDELYLNGPGMLSNEAMASGCVVLTKYLDEYSGVFPAPIISVNKDTLYDKLKALVENREEISIKAKEGRRFVETFLKPELIAKHMLDKLSQPLAYDYVPNYYLNHRDQFIPEKNKKHLKDVEEQVISLYNKSK